MASNAKSATSEASPPEQLTDAILFEGKEPVTCKSFKDSRKIGKLLTLAIPRRSNNAVAPESSPVNDAV